MKEKLWLKLQRNRSGNDKKKKRRISEGDRKQVIRKIYVWYLLCFSCPWGGYSIDDGLTTKFFYLRKLK